MSLHWEPNASLEAIRQRARLLKLVRDFFDQRHFIEVDTPALSRAATTDPNIDSFACENTSGRWYLHASPEFPMKRLLAAYAQPIYQLCKVFRQDESGPLHNPEFTMLEWYRPGCDLNGIMDETTLLLLDLVKTLSASVNINASEPVVTLSYAEAFEKSTGINPHVADARQCREYAQSNHIEIPVGMGENLDEWLDWLLIQVVILAFPADQFVFLRDYPASQAALSTIAINSEGIRVADRFEVFLGEVELANGFNELTDAGEQRLRFENENKRRLSLGREKLPLDESLIAALEHLKPCAGVAIGFDRLLMVLGNFQQIQDVLSFSQERA